MVPKALFHHRKLLVILLIAIMSLPLWLNVSPARIATGKGGHDNKITKENKHSGTKDWDSKELKDAKKNRKVEEDRDEAHLSYADSGSGDLAPAWSGPRTIQGYASQTSINHGESISFFVSTTQSSYRLDIYRMGWYSGAGARLILTVQNLPGTNYGVPVPDSSTGLIAAHWPVAYTLRTDTDWVTGVYQAKFTANNGSVGYTTFVVRDDSTPADILYQVPVATWQAYNNWGGKSLYDFNSDNGRAYKVSFDRPYQQFAGAGAFYDNDYGMIRWLEAQGYDISYVTSTDLEANPNLLDRYTMFLSDYHDEYYSKNMRDHLTHGLNEGVHLAFFGSNNIYWQIRYESSDSGVPNRVMTCYKSASLDPMNSSGTSPLTTVRWRDNPVNQPENAILGVMYGDYIGYGNYFPWVVTNASNWVYQGTGLSNGDSIPNVVTNEDDWVWNNGHSPAGLVKLSSSSTNTSNLSNASVYTAASGAIVFDASTSYWSQLLDSNSYSAVPPDSRIQQMTTNILTRMLGSTPSPNTPTPQDTIAPTFQMATDTPVPTAVPPTDTPRPTVTVSASGLRLQYYAGNTNSKDSSISPVFQIVNGTSSPVHLYELKIRYWFTRDTARTVLFKCNFAEVGCGNLYGSFTYLSSPRPGADAYLVIGFNGSAGDLAANRSTGEIYTTENKNDHSIMDQTNDYSFDASKTSFADWTRITLYRNGTLVWGTEP